MNNNIKIKGVLRAYAILSVICGILLLLVSCILLFIDIYSSLIMYAFTVIYIGVFAIVIIRTKPVIINELVSFATHYGQIQKKLLRDLELPHAILDESGKVLWTNKAFDKVIKRDNGYRKSITSIFPEITDKEFPTQDKDGEVSFTYLHSEYRASLKRISLKDMAEFSDIIESNEYDGFIIAIYLFDETAIKIALKENDDQSLAIGMIYLDNYEEALDSIEEVRRSLLTALIERKINKYISSVDGIAKRLEKDKFLIILRKKSLIQLKESKFDLIEDVKTVNIGNEMAVTMSIGVGLGGLTYSQNYEFARNAIDLALGRGGDQAIVKTPSQIQYYGGKSQQVDRNTRVKSRVKAHALQEIINGKDRVIIMGHKLTDVDSFGASVGIYRVCRSLQRRAYIVVNDISTSLHPLVDMFRDNDEYEDDMIINSQHAIELAGSSTALVIVDVNRPSITECPELLRLCKSIVVLDHHRQSEETIDNATLSYIEPYASSASEMVAEILQYIDEDVKLKPTEADCLYAGIMIDTNNFLNKTGVRTFEAAAYLKRNGTDVTKIRKLFREEANEYKARADAVGQAEIYRGYYAISICNSDGLISPTIVGAQAANELLNIKGIKASFVLTQYQGKIYTSARSIDEVNVQLIVERMGGGGHLSVAGVQFEYINMGEAIMRIKDTIDAMIEEGAL